MYNVNVEADSITAQGDRLTTMVVTMPRMMLPELNTHRMFSRNSASSRAIPTPRQLARIQDDPFVPFYWGKNQSGMQAAEEISEDLRSIARDEWLSARDNSVSHAKRLHAMGVHKQTANRPLEPYMWHTVIITATEWENFFALRVNPEAQPEIRWVAQMMLAEFHESQPAVLGEGQWHLPFIQEDEYDGYWETTPEARMVSAARCARISYLTHDGQRDHTADLDLYWRLRTSGHMSPLEHVATPFTTAEREVREALAQRARQLGAQYLLDDNTVRQLVEATAFNGNFRGWTQLRKTVPGEENFALLRQE